jgi:FKBP-type peptidyl-prolyl cis-trans isomerase (trigger factor)
MKVVVKKIDALKRELKFEIPKDRVSKKIDEVYEEIGKVAKIKGYRPGKAPRNVVETHHGGLAREETLKKLIPEVYREGIQQEKIDPLDLPEIGDVQFKDGMITFTATVDIKPEVTIKDYKNIPVKRKSSAVTSEELDKMLDYFKKSQGQEKEALDDAFARGLGYPNLDALKQALTRQMEIDKDRQNRMDVENQLIEALLKNAKLSVPQSLLKRQMEHRVEEAKHRLKHQGLSDEDIKKREEEIRKDLEKVVEKDVKAYLIFDKIAELENITVAQGENLPAKVIEFLLKQAKWEEESRIIT